MAAVSSVTELDPAWIDRYWSVVLATTLMMGGSARTVIFLRCARKTAPDEEQLLGYHRDPYSIAESLVFTHPHTEHALRKKKRRKSDTYYREQYTHIKEFYGWQ